MSVPSQSLAQGAWVNVVTRSGAVVLGLLITLVAARLGTEAVGVFALFTAVESALLALASGGGIVLARRISHFGWAPGGALSALVLTSLILGALVAAAVWSASQWGDSAYQGLWILAVALPLLLLTPNVSGLWLGQGRMRPLGWLTLGTPALTLLIWALGTRLGAPATVATLLWVWVGARSLVALGASAAALRQTGWAAPEGHWLRSQTRPMLILGLTNLVSLLNYKVDVFLVERWLGLSATGVYAVAVMLAELLWFVSSSLSQAAFARIGTPDRAQAAALALRVMHFSIAALLAVAPFLYVTAVWLVPWWLGPAYAEVRPLLAVLLPAVLAYAPASVLSAYFTNHAGRPGIPALMASGSLLINVLVCSWAIPSFGTLGAALATLVSYALTMACLLTWFRRHAGCSWRQVLWPRPGQLRDDGRAVLALWRHLITRKRSSGQRMP
ncbi:MAG: polysaccharide biosynthesis C-terminal domain-containing protein [Pseudomonadota bacterium]